jgi:transposase
MITKPKKMIDLQRAEILAAQGLTNEQVAAGLGISEATLYNNKRENKDFTEALTRGRAKGVTTVTNKFFEIIQAKDSKGQYIYDADTRLNAMKFFLERRGGWVKQEKSKVDLQSSDGSMSPLDVTVEFIEAGRDE